MGEPLEHIGLAVTDADESRLRRSLARSGQRFDTVKPFEAFLVFDGALLVRGKRAKRFVVTNPVALREPPPKANVPGSRPRGYDR